MANMTTSELIAERARINDELRAARKADRMCAAARRRAGKALCRWAAKYAHVLSLDESRVMDGLIAGLAPEAAE